MCKSCKCNRKALLITYGILTIFFLLGTGAFLACALLLSEDDKIPFFICTGIFGIFSLSLLISFIRTCIRK